MNLIDCFIMVDIDHVKRSLVIPIITIQISDRFSKETGHERIIVFIGILHLYQCFPDISCP